MRQLCPVCVLCLGCPEADSYCLHGLVALLRHISLNDDCVARAVLCLGRGVHIWGALFVCTHSWRCGRFDWRACHCNPIQGRFLQIFPLPSRWWSRSSALGSWGDVRRVFSPHTRCQSHKWLRQIEWGATYGSIGRVLWLPRSMWGKNTPYISSRS